MRIKVNKMVTMGRNGLDVRYGVWIDGVPFDEYDEEQYQKFKEAMEWMI